MKSFFRSFFACLLSIIVLFLIVVCVVALKSTESTEVQDQSYLIVEIYGDLPEYNPPGGMMAEMMGNDAETVTRILANLEKAAVDDRIKGVIFHLSSTNGAGLASLEEIRASISGGQATGKKVYGYSDSMNRKTYYLASACDSLYMPSVGSFNFTGMAAVSQHLKGTLEKLGIKPNLHQIKDYKSMAEMFMRDDMSDAARENTEWILDEYWEMTIDALIQDRGFTEEGVLELMEMAIISAKRALENNLIDEVLYWDELVDRLKIADEDELRTISQSEYAGIEPESLGLKGDKKIVVVHAMGMIGGRESGVNPMFGPMIGHESVISELKKARQDENVAGIVFRIDSGGGESLASDLIAREIEVTNKIKPVVASMVDIAASGGYYIAYKAGKIMADPMTLTGSIGSISMKFNIKKLQDKLGVTNDAVTRGPNALMWAGFSDFTDKQWEIFTADHWEGFNDWLGDIADHRGMKFEEAESLAHGRVWSGRQAKENGLIDELGGQAEAIELVKELAGIPADESVTVVHYPEKKSLIEEILSGDGGFTLMTKAIIYKMIRKELVETRRLLNSTEMYLSEDFSIE